MQTRNFASKQRSCRAAGATVTVTLLLTLLTTLLRIDVAVGRPDVRQSPFALDLQPPLLEAATDAEAFTKSNDRTVDSYGNPIDALRPIDTPDGRKVVSAQGVQFEIPNYASGITEIRQPADDLLPPHIDAIAIAVAQSTTSDTDTDTDTVSTSFAPAPQPATSLTPPKHESSPTTTSTEVEVEQAQLQEHQEQREESAHAPQLASGPLPDYLLELQRQDPLIDGPVPWIPAPHGTPLSVIAWDLLPPLETATEPQAAEPLIITEQQPTKHVVGVEQPGSHNIHFTLGSGQGLSPVAPTVGHVTSGQVAVVPLERDGPEAHGTNAHVGSTTPRNNAGRFPSRHRGTVHYSTTTGTQRPRTTSSTSTTTTTRPPLTTRGTTTRRTTTTPRTTTTTPTPRSTTTSTTTVRSTTPLDPSTFYKLENEEEYAYTLPPWLQEVTDPDLDVAVTFIVPTDNDQYNHTLNEDLEPPFEPFVDLHNIQLTPPPTARLPTTSTTTTTTTARPTTTTTTTTTTRRPSSTTSTTTTTTSTTKAPIFKAQQPLQPQLIPTTVHTAPGAQHQGTGTSTTATPSVDPNPFDSATLPPWLQDFDYPDVGPGVPYNPDNFKDESPVGGPGAGGAGASGGSKPNDFQPQGFGSRLSNSQFTTTTTTTTRAPLNPITTITTTSSPATVNSASSVSASVSDSAFPSKVTLPLPGNNNDEEELPLVLIPPVDESSSPLGSSSSSFDSSLPPPAFSLDPNPNPTENSISHFPAPFDPPAIVSGQAPSSLPATEQFPLSASDSQKVEYTKSDEGKVISTPVNTLRKDSQPSVAPATPTAAPTPTRSSASNTGKYTGGFGAPAGLLRPQQQQSVAKPDIYVAGNEQEFSHTIKANRQRPGAAPAPAANTGRYTGGFGAPSGVLSPISAPRPFQQTQSQYQPQPQATQAQATRSHPAQVAGAASSHHHNRFGGPPGILVPFDNVQRTAQQ